VTGGAAPAVLLEGVEQRYEQPTGTVEALRGVDLAVPEGEYLWISGRSGSGKSTLLAVMAGLLVPTRGEVRLLGRSTRAASAGELAALRAAEVGFVFQDFGLVSHLSALENVCLPRYFAAPRGAHAHARARECARELLAGFGLADRAAHRPDELSGGEQQRVALARALVNEPRVLFADEPTANLDAESAELVAEHLRRLHAERWLTVVLAAHRTDGVVGPTRRVQLERGGVARDEAP